MDVHPSVLFLYLSFGSQGSAEAFPSDKKGGGHTLYRGPAYCSFLWTCVSIDYDKAVDRCWNTAGLLHRLYWGGSSNVAL